MIMISPFKWASANFFGYFCTYGVLLPFIPVWLNHYGYSTETIGLLAAVGYIFRFLGGIAASQRVKQVEQLLPTARMLTWLNVIAAVLLACSSHSIWLLFPALMLFQFFNAGAIPIGDSIASLWQRQINLDYGKARLFGSLAFIVGSISTGYLISWLGESSIVWIMTSFLIFLGICQSFIPSQGFSEPKTQNVKHTVSYMQLLKNATTLKMLICASLILSSHAAYYTYSTIHWSNAGISTEVTSLFWGLAVSAEILLFLVSKRLFKVWKTSHLIILAASFSVVRWALMATTTEIPLLVLAQTFHAISFGVTHFTMVRYISAQPAAEIPKLQALYFGLASCAVMALFTFIAGMTYQGSPSFTFWLMAFLVAPALFIVPKQIK